MKVQDIVFVAIFAILVYRRNPQHIAWVGAICLLISMPIFYSLKSLFTAERLTYYAVAFFLASIVLQLINLKKEFKKI